MSAYLSVITCRKQIENPEKVEANHWRCLNDSMWSQVPAVQVVVWRMLKRLSAEGWPQDLLDMLYLDESTQAWAKATGEEQRRSAQSRRFCNPNQGSECKGGQFYG